MVKKILMVLVIIIIILIIYFNIPFSLEKNKFQKNIDEAKKSVNLENNKGKYKKEDFEKYPEPIRKYFEQSGFIGKDKMDYLNIFYDDVDFKMEDKKLKMTYDQYNFCSPITRIAYMKTGIMGIPFEGIDSYYKNEGSMKGVIAKSIELFNQKGEEFNQGTLVTYLSESLFFPTSILEEDIQFKEINKYEVESSLTYNNITVKGIFKFNENYEMIEFVTDERYFSDTKGNKQKEKWTAKCLEYEKNDEGINLPKKLQAIWNLKDGDLIYFDGKIKAFNLGKLN